MFHLGPQAHPLIYFSSLTCQLWWWSFPFRSRGTVSTGPNPAGQCASPLPMHSRGGARSGMMAAGSPTTLHRNQLREKRHHYSFSGLHNIFYESYYLLLEYSDNFSGMEIAVKRGSSWIFSERTLYCFSLYLIVCLGFILYGFKHIGQKKMYLFVFNK